MPATTLTVTTIGTNGALVADQSSDVANGNQFRNRPGKTFLMVYNGDASSRTITIPCQVATRPADGTFGPQATDPITQAMAAGTRYLFGPFPQSFNDGNDNVQITWSASTPTTVKAVPFEIP